MTPRIGTSELSCLVWQEPCYRSYFLLSCVIRRINMRIEEAISRSFSLFHVKNLKLEQKLLYWKFFRNNMWLHVRYKKHHGRKWQLADINCHCIQAIMRCARYFCYIIPNRIMFCRWKWFGVVKCPGRPFPLFFPSPSPSPSGPSPSPSPWVPEDAEGITEKYFLCVREREDGVGRASIYSDL